MCGSGEELSKSLKLNFVEKENLMAACANEAKLRSYAKEDSGQPSAAVVPIGPATASSLALVEQRDDLPREVITLCMVEGDLTPFDERCVFKLRKTLAAELDGEVTHKQIRFCMNKVSDKLAAKIGTCRCRLRVEVSKSGYAQYSSDMHSGDESSSSDVSAEDMIERSVERVTSSRHWPSHIEAADIEVKGMFEVII